MILKTNVSLEMPSGLSAYLHNTPSFIAPIFSMNNELSLALEVFAGRTNVLESSSNMTAWTRVKTFSNTNGPVSFSTSKEGPHLFYQLRLE